MRSIAAKIRDEYDLHSEDKFHNLFYRNVRPDFMEPLPKYMKIKNKH